METLKNRVLKSLDSIRPYLIADGGDVELISVDEEAGVVEVKLKGACGHCPMSQMTLRAGIERALKNSVPEIKRVEAV